MEEKSHNFDVPTNECQLFDKYKDEIASFGIELLSLQ